MTTLHPT